jgi:hypothetical protein
VPEQIIEGEEIVVPLFEIAAHPSIRLSEIKARRFYIVDRAQIKAKEAIAEGRRLQHLQALIAAANANGSGCDGCRFADDRWPEPRVPQHRAA